MISFSCRPKPRRDQSQHSAAVYFFESHLFSSQYANGDRSSTYRPMSKRASAAPTAAAAAAVAAVSAIKIAVARYLIEPVASCCGQGVVCEEERDWRGERCELGRDSGGEGGGRVS